MPLVCLVLAAQGTEAVKAEKDQGEEGIAPLESLAPEVPTINFVSRPDIREGTMAVYNGRGQRIQVIRLVYETDRIPEVIPLRRILRNLVAENAKLNRMLEQERRAAQVLAELLGAKWREESQEWIIPVDQQLDEFFRQIKDQPWGEPIRIGPGRAKEIEEATPTLQTGDNVMGGSIETQGDPNE